MADHLLMDVRQARGVLDRLEARAVVARQYTGRDRGGNHAYVATKRGAAFERGHFTEEEQ